MKEQSMLKLSIVIIGLVTAMFVIPAVHSPAYAQSSSAEAREEQIYRSGTTAMNTEQWQNAIDQFSQIKGSKADGAAYWKAYAQNKLGQRAAALETIGALLRQYPRSSWTTEAKALEIEMRPAGGQAGASVADSDENLKLLAINGLMNMDPERAVPLLQQVLTGTQSMKIKERALFVLSQSGSDRAQDLMSRIARGEVQPDLQVKAIQNLGIAGKKKLLSDIYASSSSTETKRAALNAMGIGGARDELLTAARSERDPQLRRDAVNGLAIAGAREQLRQLYKETTDPQAKRDLIHSAVVTGDSDLLTNAVQSESDPDIKREALQTLGITGGQKNAAFLTNIYTSDKDPRLREAAINGLFVSGAAHELVELAKKETDPGMKSRLVSKLSIMSNKEATDYLIQLLEK
jgi:HEAT repeat protein